MLKRWEFTLPTNLHFGRGTLRGLGEISTQLGKTALVVGYRNEPNLEEELDRAVRSLAKAGVRVATFLEIEGEPSAGQLLRGVDFALQEACDLVIGLGGGSVLDAAKAIAALAVDRGKAATVFEDQESSGGIRPGLASIAIPTSAGTGSEVSDLAVFSCLGPATCGGKLKRTLWGPGLRPSAAIVDPELTLGTPPDVTAASGADALAHAIESVLSRRATPISSLLATEAVRLILRHLRRACERPGEIEPREGLALAATFAGAAFTSAGVTMAHAIAHGLGAVLGVPHAKAVAESTIAALRFNAADSTAELAELAEKCGIDGPSIETRASSFVSRIEELLRDLRLNEGPMVPADDYEATIDQLVENAAASCAVPIKLNPRRVSNSDLRTVLTAIVSKGPVVTIEGE